MTGQDAPEQTDNPMPKAGNRLQATRPRRRKWLIAFAVVLVAIIGGFLWIAVAGRDRRSADERLAEIEAARAIPDTENAAMIYNQLLEDPNGASDGDDLPESVSPSTFERACREPWRSRDLPTLAGWVTDHQPIAVWLIEASRKEKCRFPISIDDTDARFMDRVASMRWWGYLLSIAANNDVAEGRIDDALLKWHCLIQVDNHLRQQPTRIDHLTGMSTSRFVPEAMALFLVQGAPAEAHLQKIEAMPLIVANGAAKYLREAHEIEQLMELRMTENFGPLDHLRYFWLKHVMNAGLFHRASVGDETYLYHRSAAMARGLRILVALRRYRNTTGRWPESLDEIKPSLSEEILTDPLNKGPFVYKRASDAFRLYSKGRNNKDEDGKYDPHVGPDDWPIWPPRGRSPEPEPRDANSV